MPRFKVTLLMQMTSATSRPNDPLHRVAGFSESYYGIFDSLQQCIDTTVGTALAPNGLARRRAALLPSAGAVIGQRYVQLPGVGEVATSKSGGTYIPGRANEKCDTPYQSLLCTIPASNGNNISHLRLRAIPDDHIDDGEYRPVGTFANDLASFFNALGEVWEFRGINLNAQKKIIRITSAGVMTTEIPHGLLVDNKITILRTIDPFGIRRGRDVTVTDVSVNGFTATIDSWPYGECKKGSFRLNTGYNYFRFDGTRASAVRVVSRRVGAPFGSWVGRVKKNRRLP